MTSSRKLPCEWSHQWRMILLLSVMWCEYSHATSCACGVECGRKFDAEGMPPACTLEPLFTESDFLENDYLDVMRQDSCVRVQASFDYNTTSCDDADANDCVSSSSLFGGFYAETLYGAKNGIGELVMTHGTYTQNILLDGSGWLYSVKISDGSTLHLQCMNPQHLLPPLQGACTSKHTSTFWMDLSGKCNGCEGCNVNQPNNDDIPFSEPTELQSQMWRDVMDSNTVAGINNVISTLLENGELGVCEDKRFNCSSVFGADAPRAGVETSTSNAQALKYYFGAISTSHSPLFLLFWKLLVVGFATIATSIIVM